VPVTLEYYKLTRSHPEMVGDMSCVTVNFDLLKITFCAFLARVKTHTHTKNETCTFTGSHLRAVIDADNDDDNAGHHSTTTRATYHQLHADKAVMCASDD